jgi:hypothetical protein
MNRNSRGTATDATPGGNQHSVGASPSPCRACATAVVRTPYVEANARQLLERVSQAHRMDLGRAQGRPPPQLLTVATGQEEAEA